MSDERDERADRLLALSRQIRETSTAKYRSNRRRALKWVQKDCREERAALMGVSTDEVTEK